MSSKNFRCQLQEVQRKALEQCEVGDWVSFEDLFSEGWVDFLGVLDCDGGDVWQFEKIELSIEGEAKARWRRVK